MRAHVASGRWEVVNGWWTQPDCNIPSALGLSRQIRTGLAYVKDRFGLHPRCGFNPDSFGHCSILPELLREHGQDRYVFMRPQEHERELPSRLFRWRGKEGGAEVTAFRIAGGYGNSGSLDAIRYSLSHMPAGCQHAMTFLGLGDHGGGPTERIIAWVRSQMQAIPDARIVFSTVGRFLDAVEAERLALPTVTGELQYHAMGCYSVMRSVKTGIRRTEHLLAQAEGLAESQDAAALDESWRRVCSHQFHDTLGGTCLASAYGFVLDELGGAAATAERIAHLRARRRLTQLPDDPLPRIVLVNPDRQALTGWQEVETYVENSFRRPWRLLDEQGKEVPFQSMNTEAMTDAGWWWGKRRLLLRQELTGGAVRALRQDLSQPPAPIPAQVANQGGILTSLAGATADLSSSMPRLSLAGRLVTCPTLLLVDDTSDTWSHGADRFREGGQTARWCLPRAIDHGPLMASLRQEGLLGGSGLIAEWRVYAGEAWVDLLLEVHWAERHKVLKLVVPHHGGASRRDAVPGMTLVRPNDGAERPLGEWTDLGSCAVVSPDVFALDAVAHQARLTLLRSPLIAHHDPHPGSPARPAWTDQGVHTFRFRFVLQATTPERLDDLARSISRPALTADCTKGMGPRDA